MELQHLKEFVVLEQIRNYTLAADELYTTEATLSRHIKALEKELKNQLFTRTTRKVQLTEFGRKFLVYAIKIVQTMEECETNLLNKSSIDENLLMIGIFGVITNYTIIQDALFHLSVEYPEYIVGTVQGDINNQKDKIINGKYNLAIVREGSGEFDDQFERRTILKEPLCVVIPKNDPLAKEETVNIASLRERNLTLPSERMLAYRLLIEQCRNLGFEPNIASLLQEREFIQSFASAGNGITVLSKNMAERSANPMTQVVKELSPTIYEYINLLFLKMAALPEMTANAIRCFENVIKEKA